MVISPHSARVAPNHAGYIYHPPPLARSFSGAVVAASMPAAEFDGRVWGSAIGALLAQFLANACGARTVGGIFPQDDLDEAATSRAHATAVSATTAPWLVDEKGGRWGRGLEESKLLLATEETTAAPEAPEAPGAPATLRALSLPSSPLPEFRHWRGDFAERVDNRTRREGSCDVGRVGTEATPPISLATVADRAVVVVVVDVDTTDVGAIPRGTPEIG